MDPVISLAVAIAVLALGSILLSPLVRTEDSFFRGISPTGRAPRLLMLILSQVTTWIFARSLMNAAILGFYYGISGTIAYAAYYFSFLTGGAIVRSLRFEQGHGSVQSFLEQRFGALGAGCYNAVVAVRLVSEVFANLLVVGLLFGAAGSDAYTASILAVAVVTLGYSMFGGLHASLRTDVLQMVVFLVLLAVLGAIALSSDGLSAAAIAGSSTDATGPGWVLLVVALLQVWSYPLHDPVMMDRGFLADRRTTILSFLHAAWISILCVLGFGLLGVYAGLNALADEAMVPALHRLLGEIPMLIFNVALALSAMSTLDSTCSSAAKLTVVDMRLVRPTVFNGRVAMAAFMLAGIAMVFLGSKDLFAAVAVSGTASMYLAPVIFFSIWGRRDAPLWSYMTAFVAALSGAALYFFDSSGYSTVMRGLTGFEHKYTHLLVICVAVLLIGCAAFTVGIAARRARPRMAMDTGPA